MKEEIPPATVLLYHDVLTPGCEPTAERGSVQTERLVEHIEALSSCGFEPVSLGEAFRLLCDGVPARGPKFAVTFDDAYEGVYGFFVERAALCRALRPTVFVLTDHVGGHNLSWNTRASVILRHLSQGKLEALAEMGAELASHSCDHHNLLKFERSEVRLRLTRSIEWFEAHLGHRPRYLAYPYGYCDRTVIETAAEMFEGAVSVTHGAWMGPAARHALNRISVPFFLRGADLVEVVRQSPASRWLEIEKRAPWR